LDQRTDIVDRPDHGLIYRPAHLRLMMGVGIEPPADVQYSPPVQQSGDGRRDLGILTRAFHQQASIDYRLSRCTPLTGRTPVAKAMPQGKPDEGVVDLVHEPPEPVEPEWLKRVDRRAAEQCPSTPQVRPEPPAQFRADCK